MDWMKWLLKRIFKFNEFNKEEGVMPKKEEKEEKLPHEYDNVTLFIGGKPKKVSRSSKYLLDMMTLD